jgi:hypothetical protein
MNFLKYEKNQKRWRERNKEKIAKKAKENRRCRENGCEKWEAVRGFCRAHYQSLRAMGDERLSIRVIQSSPDLESRAAEYAKELEDDAGYSPRDALSRARAAFGLEAPRNFEVMPRMNAIEFTKRSDYEPFGSG